MISQNLKSMDLLSNFQKGNFSQVIDQWNNNQFQVSSDPESAFIIAASYFRIGNIEKAYEICEALEGPFSTNSSFLSMYAAILRRLNLLSRAEEVFKKALDISPDSKEVKNNYSNLLIDQGRYSEAINMLKAILEKHNDYEDAIVNLRRAESLMEENKSNMMEKVDKKENRVDTFGDPLDQAFNTDEVNRLGGKIGSMTAAIKEILTTDEKQDIEEAELELLKLANEQNKNKLYKDSLELVSKIREKIGLYGPLYKAASDALIGMERFKDAEINAMLAFINNDINIPNLINLASLAAMRKDQHMAKYWLQKAEEIDKSNSLIKDCKELLFPEGKARDVDNPFKH